MIDIPLKARVECADGECGESVTVIVDPVARKVTHFVVDDGNLVQRIVSIDQVVETTPDSIHLSCSKEEVAKMEPFLERHFIKQVQPNPDYRVDHGVYVLPYASPTQIVATPVEVDRVLPGEIAVRRGTLVEATDGYVGKVGEFLVDRVNGRITHLVLQEGHFWGRMEVTLPLSAIDRIQDDTVYLKLDKKGIESLPSIPMKRDYQFWWPWREVELVVQVYHDRRRAIGELDFVAWLQRARRINILNAGALVRDDDGKTSLKETVDPNFGNGRLFGAITGGLIGLVCGPASAAVGALAGAGTGDLAADWLDMGFSGDFLAGLRARLQPGTSALVVLGEHDSVARLSKALAGEEGWIFQQALTDKTVEELLQASKAEE